MPVFRSVTPRSTARRPAHKQHPSFGDHAVSAADAKLRCNLLRVAVVTLVQRVCSKNAVLSDDSKPHRHLGCCPACSCFTQRPIDQLATAATLHHVGGYSTRACDL